MAEARPHDHSRTWYGHKHGDDSNCQGSRCPECQCCIHCPLENCGCNGCTDNKLCMCYEQPLTIPEWVVNEVKDKE